LFSRSTRRWSSIVLTCGPVLLTGGAYLAVNYLYFGHFVPTSGLVKSIGGEAINTRFVHQLLNPMNPEGTLWNTYLGLLCIALGYAIHFALRRWRWSGGGPLESEDYVAAIVSVFFLFFTAYQLFGTSWVLWRWYGYPIFLMGIFVVPRVAESALARLAACENLDCIVTALRAVTSLSIVVAMAVIGIRWGNWRRPTGILFAHDNYLLAKELNGRLKSPVTVGMGDRAGSFAFFFEGQVLQLEGLVGDYDLVRAIEDDTLAAYMAAFDVDYVVSYYVPPQGYTQWDLLVPHRGHTCGEHAHIRLCRETELMRREMESGTVVVWQWPSCDA